jgi:hypothetical protein
MMLLGTVALMLALMLALSGPALANHRTAPGGGGRIDNDIFTGGGGSF